MDKKVIDLLHARAKRFGAFLTRLPKRSDYQDWETYRGEDLDIRLLEPGRIRFTWNKYAFIDFADVTPVEITKKILHEPVLIGSEKQDVSSSVVTNNSEGASLQKEYSLTTKETKKMDQEVGVSVTTGFKYTVGTGGTSPVKAELELSASIEASYNKAWGSESTTERTSKTVVTVPPRTEVTLTQVTETSNYEQRCEYWCKLDHKTTVFSHDDFNHTWNSLGELKTAMLGRADETVELGRHWFINPVAPDEVNRRIGDSTAYLDRTVKFSNAISGNVNVVETTL